MRNLKLSVRCSSHCIKTCTVPKSVTPGYPFTHWTEMYRPHVYDDIYRCQLSFTLEFSVLTMKAAQVWLDAWNEVRWTLCSFFCECQPLNSTEIDTRGCQRVVHSLPTPHMQFTLRPVLKDTKSAWYHDLTWLRCIRLLCKTQASGILTSAVRILVCVYWAHRFIRCMVCWIRKLSYCWNVTMIPVT